jgi:hypothetical protein
VKDGHDHACEQEDCPDYRCENLEQVLHLPPPGGNDLALASEGIHAVPCARVSTTRYSLKGQQKDALLYPKAELRGIEWEARPAATEALHSLRTSGVLADR